ncbi:MAG: polyamine aminopropyltransferase [Geminicoccaceae bacterium]|nr:polyamine aminopropyltransferase [Geminicoccaceae bacterium]
MADWFTETLHQHWAQRLRVDRVLYHEKTQHQDLIVFENAQWGRVLALDGVVQTTTGDESAYHEMLVHPAVLAHGRVRDVCIVGGGDGGTAREVLKHEGVRRVVEAELDPDVIAFCKTYLPTLSDGCYESPRLSLVYGDAADFMRGEGDRFDVIVVDSTDPIGPGASLFTVAFYKDCRRRLKEGGILVSQCGVPSVQPWELAQTQARQRAAGFADVDYYLVAVPTYVGGMMALGWASDDPTRRRVRVDTLRSRPQPSGLRYYTPDVHVAAFAHPAWMDEAVRKGG